MPSGELLPSDPAAEQEDRPRKRRRKIWSCLECRRRKLQCDRAFPICSRCAKAGTEAQCSYLDDLAPTQPSQPAFHNRFGQSELPQSSAVDVKRSSPNQPTISKPASERASASFVPAADSVPTSTLERRLDSARFRDPMQLPASSSREKYRRSSHIRSVVNLVPGLSDFSKETRENDHSVDQIRSELHTSQINMLSNLAKQVRPETDEDLRKLLPPKPETDRLVSVYLESYDYIYNILDHAAFLEEYEELWTAPQEMNPDLVVLILLIIAVARSLTAMSTEGNMVIRGEVASIIESCEAFLLTKIRKQTTILDFQIAFLTLLARQINGNRFKRTWSNAGKTLRDFMSRHPVAAGLHRGRKPLDEEARPSNNDIGRRIWLAIAEFELQAAFEQGMPAIPWAQSSDLLPPTISIEDEDQEFTRSSYLVIAKHSLLLRHTLNSLLNNIHEPITYLETKAWTEKLQACLYALPSWTDPKALVSLALLRLNLLQYILALHERQGREAKTPFEQNACRTLLLDTAMNVIEIHQSVVDGGSYVVELLFEDHLRAALTICYVYTSLDPMMDSLLSKVASRYAMRSMEQAISLLALKAKRYGFDHRQMWITIAAAGFMRTSDKPDEKQTYMQQTAKNFTDLFQEKVSQQEKIENGHGNDIGSAMGPQNLQQPTFDASNLWELENWMLDEWPFGDEALDYWAVL